MTIDRFERILLSMIYNCFQSWASQKTIMIQPKLAAQSYFLRDHL